MTSYTSQPTPQWPDPGAAPPAEAQFVEPERSRGQGDRPAPGPEWQTGPQGPWSTAEGEPWPDWPDGIWQDPDDGQDRSGQQRERPPEQDQGGDQRAGLTREAEPAGEQWSAQLRMQAPVVAGQLNERPAGPDERWAMISYLGVPFLAFVPPLFVYMIKLHTSPFARQHAAQALNLSITVLLYNVCAVIMGGLLALDSVGAALVIVVPLLAVLWLVTLAYLVLAGTAASRGDHYRIPGWLCATLVR